MSLGGEGLTSERGVVAVLFADIAGFTAMAEHLDPETVTDMMNDIFAVLGAEVEAVGGHVDKVVGDALMALFGAPVAHEDDALRAVRAGVRMQRAMQARQDLLRRAFGQAPRLRIGLPRAPVGGGVAAELGGPFFKKGGYPVVVKGRAEPIAVYEVIGGRERAEPMYRPPF